MRGEEYSTRIAGTDKNRRNLTLIDSNRLSSGLIDLPDPPALGVASASPELAFGAPAAFHRLAAVGTDGRVLLIGASRDTDFGELLAEAAFFGKVLQLPGVLFFEHPHHAANEDNKGVGDDRRIVGRQPAGKLVLLREDMDAGVMDGIVLVIGSIKADVEDCLGFGRILVPRDLAASHQEVLVVAREFGEGSVGDIREFHLGFLGRARAGGTLGDVRLAGARGLGHLVVLTTCWVALAVKETLAKIVVGEMDDACQHPRIQMAEAA